MELASQTGLRPPLLCEPAEDGQERADGESEEQQVVGALAEELVRAESTPEDGGGEEGVDTWAGETPWGVGGADAVHVHLEVEDTSAYKGGDEGGDQLRPESGPWGKLAVVRELEVVGEVDSLSSGNVTEGLEVVHAEGVTLDETTTDELGDDVKSDLDTGDGGDHADGDDEDQGEDDAEDDDGGRGVGFPATDTAHAECGGDDEDGNVPPLGDFFVGAHESPVDILGEVGDAAAALAEELFEADGDFVTVEQGSVDQCGGVDGEEPEVDGQVTGGHPWHGVFLVLFFAQNLPAVCDTADVEGLSLVVEDVVAVDGEVGSVPGVCEVDADNHEETDSHPSELVESGKSGNDKRVILEGDDVPVERGPWVQAETIDGSDDVVEYLVVGRDP